jgi:hypothetical protein
MDPTAAMDPTVLFNAVGALGTPGAILLAAFWFFRQLEATRLLEKKAADELRASEKKANDEVLRAHLTQLKEIADTNKASAETLNGAMTMFHGIIGEIRGIQRATHTED